MPELSDLDGLLAQFKEQARETIRAEFRAETEVLRTKNRLLQDKIDEKDLLYQDAICEKDELAQQAQSQQLEITKLHARLKRESSLRSSRIGSTQEGKRGSFEGEMDQKAPSIKADRDLGEKRELAQQSLRDQNEAMAGSVTFGGFEILERPGTRFYREMFDGSTFNDEGAALRKLSMFFKPSKVKPEILRPHQWQLLGIETRTEEDKEEPDQDPIDSLSPEPQDLESPKTSSKLPKQPRVQRGYEQRVQARSTWLNKDASCAVKDKGLESDTRCPGLASVVPRKRDAEEFEIQDIRTSIQCSIGVVPSAFAAGAQVSAATNAVSVELARGPE
ncbi:uncharacterized protein MYCFIDRAFT_194318 [Pseudocercospora fijiensis CIRAD86]|uniref:Uncharacterized protein n=1 Tax=Pseudocercospora fijiensis (strain CIRAD86) TaxID=383855 RepID=M3BAA8_PSEFD|nr:uncharacterized protein MYCFIDRAFT_194318 [Pseudocercospora fijiensis CIRAD86]EME86188.1 hypothetical protein MYCFIDRAFT_194318 [Pseudocercospora fijiensis CIRAD86]